MAGLTPEEQAFFESGGDTSKLGLPEFPSQAQAEPSAEYSQLDRAGLGDTPQVPVATTPPVAAIPPVATPAPTAAPQADQAEMLRQAIAESQRQVQELTTKIEALNKPREPEVVAPDPATDPLGSLLHQLDQVNKRVAELQTHFNEQSNQRTQMDAFQRFQQQVHNLRNEFQASTADFPQAYQHLRDARVADLKAYGMSDSDINKTLFQEEVQLSQAAIQRGQNPAAAIYEMAKRHGYRAVPAATAAPTAKPDLAAVKRGVESAPPNLPRSPVGEDISVESLREASDADLNKLVTDPNAWAKIAGSSNIPI